MAYSTLLITYLHVAKCYFSCLYRITQKTAFLQMSEKEIGALERRRRGASPLLPPLISKAQSCIVFPCALNFS